MHRIKRHIGTHHFTNWKVAVFILTVLAGGALGIIYSVQAYPEVFQTVTSLDKNSDIGFTEPIVINFSQPALSSGYVSGIKVDPSESVRIKWEDSNRKLMVTPQTNWSPETNYTLTLPEGKNIMLTDIPAQKITFSTLKFPRVKNFIPAKDTRDVIIDIEDPIIIDFDKSTDGFFIKFTIDPFSKMTYQNNPEKTQFKLLPTEKAQDGVDYNIKVYARYINAPKSGYREIYASNFQTAPPPKISWEKDYNLRLEQARKFTRPKVNAGKYIDINLSAQILSTFENGKLLTANMISTGKRGMDTPKGQFKVLAKRQRPWSKKYGLYMPWFMQFTTEGHGIHELPEWPGGYKEGANHLGIPVSHGCVRLGVGPAKIIYDWAEEGTPIIIY